MTQRVTLSKEFKTENLSNRYSMRSLFFCITDDFINRLFLCLIGSNFYYLTKNHSKQCLFH